MKQQLLVGLVACLVILGQAGVANATLIMDDFNDGNMDGWTPKIGSWSVSGGSLSNSGTVYGAVWLDDSLGVYETLEVDAYFDFSTSTRDDEIGHLRLRNTYHPGATQPYWDTGYLADFRKDRIRIFNTYLNGNPLIASFDFGNSPFDNDGWYRLAFGVQGTGADTMFSAWVNGMKYIEQGYNNTVGALDSGYIGLGRKMRYDNVRATYSNAAFPVPEPATALLFLGGLLGLPVLRCRS